jgi:hypothetical protein
MTSKIAHHIYYCFVRQNFLYFELSHTHARGMQTLDKVNDELNKPKASFYQDSHLLGEIDKICYQQESKTYQENYSAIIILLGSFILMVGVSLAACTLFPTLRTQNHTSTNTLDITPILTPMQVIGH